MLLESFLVNVARSYSVVSGERLMSFYLVGNGAILRTVAARFSEALIGVWLGRCFLVENGSRCIGRGSVYCNE